jgi:glycosyltransferase involved in cell wall biosynthesis
MSKTILFITHSSGLTGGAEDDFGRIISYFSTLPNYKIHILSPVGKRFQAYNLLAEKAGNYTQGWFPVIEVGFSSYIRYFLTGMKQILQIRKFMSSVNYDFAIINVSVLFFPTLYLRCRRIKTIVFIRETITPAKLRSIYTRILSKSADHFIGVSNSNIEDLYNLGMEKNTSVLYSSIESKDDQVIAGDDELRNSVGDLNFNELSDTKSFKLLLNGNICERKNQLLALKAIDQLVNSLGIKDIKLFFVGDIESDKRYYRILIDYIMENKLDKFCFTLNAQKKSVVYKIFEKIDASLITSVSEGLPLVLVESFCFKKPVIATNVGGIKEVLVDGFTGFLLESFNETEISNKICELRTNVSQYAKMSENCYEYYLRSFNLQSNMKKLESILNGLCDTSS